MVKIDITNDIWQLTNAMLNWVERGMRKWILVLMEELKRLTPEDTREMLNSYRIEPMKFDWTNLIAEITNDTDYAIYVEYWSSVWIKFWYHKPKWSLFHTWVWNRTFARASDIAQPKILQIILHELW